MRLALSIGVSVLLFGCGGSDAGIFDEKGDGATSAESSIEDETSTADSGGTIEDTSGGTTDDGPPPLMDSSTPPPLDTGMVLPDTTPPPTDVPLPISCTEPGGKIYMGHCYFPTMMRSWVGSRDTCNSLKAHLVTITSSGEQTFVNGIAGGERWIGMFRPEGSPVAAASYRWVTTDAVSFINWDTTEPNFSGSCVRLRSDGLWADNSCSQNLTAICERE